MPPKKIEVYFTGECMQKAKKEHRSSRVARDDAERRRVEQEKSTEAQLDHLWQVAL
jgi:uncharacterized protein YaiL (DUF2058 family)